jgi:Tol biopolymer transport system component
VIPPRPYGTFAGVSAAAGTEVSDFAISPDGSRLAVISGRNERPRLNVYDKLKLSVYNLYAGTGRTYRPGGVGNAPGVPITWFTQNSLSWGADNRTLAFVYGQWRGREGVRFLDTDRPGSGLLANSRVAIPQSRTTSWTQIQLTGGHYTPPPWTENTLTAAW